MCVSIPIHLVNALFTDKRAPMRSMHIINTNLIIILVYKYKIQQSNKQSYVKQNKNIKCNLIN